MSPDFDPAASAVLRIASQEAAKRHLKNVDTGMLLLGLLDLRSGLAWGVLDLLRIDPSPARFEVATRAFSRMKDLTPGREVPYARDLMGVINDAIAQAFFRGRRSVTSVHLLFALLRAHPCDGTLALGCGSKGVKLMKRRLLQLIGPGDARDQAKMFIVDLVQSEPLNQPLSDRKLVQMLKDRGLTISPGTVAAHRGQLGIPLARDRRRTERGDDLTSGLPGRDRTPEENARGFSLPPQAEHLPMAVSEGEAPRRTPRAGHRTRRRRLLGRQVSTTARPPGPPIRPVHPGGGPTYPFYST